MTKDFGNTRRRAKRVKLRASTKKLRNLIGGNDKVDFIELSIVKRSQLSTKIKGLISRKKVLLLDEGGNVIGRFRGSGKKQKLNVLLESGSYFIKVRSKSGQRRKRYTLSLTADPMPNEEVSWKIKPPGFNTIPENIFIPTDDGEKIGNLKNVTSGIQVLLLSQILDRNSISQILNPSNSSFPFIEFNLAEGRTFSTIEIEKILGTDSNGFEVIQDYRVTLSINNNGAGSQSSGILRLPDAQNENENLNDTDVTRVVLDGSNLNGTDKSEWLYGSNLNDVIRGNSGDDYIYGNAGNDVLDGGSGDNYLNGGSGNDILDGGLDPNGFNQMRGGSGDDYYIVRNRFDNIYEQPNGGIDTAEVYVSFSLDNSDSAGSERYIETLVLAEAAGSINGEGSEENNTLLGNSSNNVLDAQDGNDVLTGGDGNDLLVGGNGQDILTGGRGFDSFAFDSPFEGIDTIKDFELGADKIRLYNDPTTGFGGSQSVFYDGNTGNLSFGISLSQSTVFARLETRPTFAEFIASNHLDFNSQLARSVF